jgi:catechol 2,3-dioxygenase-like lactoylglutathione lyase family enzyme
MITGIDHIVIVVDDLDSAVDGYSRLGFSVVRGGRHQGIGTHNALIAFADGTYLELIAFLEPISLPPHPWYRALQKGGGITDFCVQTSELEADTAAFRTAGAVVANPFHMGRERPDGYQLKWALATIEGEQQGLIPFFIRDETPRDERVPKQRSHSNGVSGIRALALALDEVGSIEAIYTRALGNPGTPIERPDIGRGVKFKLGMQELQLLQPSDRPGPLRDRLGSRGSSPFEVTLSKPGGTPTMLDTAMAARARIMVE